MTFLQSMCGGSRLLRMFTETELNQHFRYCCSLTSGRAEGRDDAWDLLQTSMEKYLRSPPKNAVAKHSYLRRIIRNQFYDEQRYHKRWQTTDTDVLDGAAGVTASPAAAGPQDFDIQTLEDVAIQQDMLDTIWETLDPTDREILFLWAVDGYSTTEVAGIINMPRGTLLSRIHRLRHAVQTNHPNLSLTGDMS